MSSSFQDFPSARIQALNLLKGQARAASFSCDSKAFTFRFKANTEDYVPSLSINFDWSGRSLVVGLKVLPELVLEGEPLLKADLGLLPLPLASALVETILASYLEGLSRVCSSKIELSHLELNPVGPPEGERLEFSIVHQATGLPWAEGCLFVADELMEPLAQLWAGAPLEKQATFATFPCLFHWEVGAQTLTYKEWTSLQLNDVIFMDEACSPEKGSLFLSSGKEPIFLAAIEGNEATLTKKLSQPSPMSSSEKSVSIEDLPVHLQFSLGEQAIPIKELQALKTGYTFQLDKAPHGPVSILANYKKIGEGELIEVGGKLGVRLLALGEGVEGVQTQAGNVFQAD